MAFKFKLAKQPVSSSQNQTSGKQPSLEDNQSDQVESKLSGAELNKLIKQYPSWLKGNSCIKNLPAVYHGVLGQVQVQPKFSAISNPKLTRQPQQNDYLDRFTDTERVYQLLLASRLPSATLATIWAHANKTFPGRLSNREVCLALALIAIFQRPDKSDFAARLASKDHKLDLYELVRLEKKPPIAKLFPISPANSTNENDERKDVLLVDLDDDSSKNLDNSKSEKNQEKSNTLDYFKSNLGNLIDTDVSRFEIDFKRLTDCWLRSLKALKDIFKESFDILNVRHGRSSAIEALGTRRGREFSKNLSLCYPLAYNISETVRSWNDISSKPSDQAELFEIGYVNTMEDLMRSINEYWAVLINLFHQTGLTKLIETMMDSLDTGSGSSIKSVHSVSDIARGLCDSQPRQTTCSLCRKSQHFTSEPFKTLSKDEELSPELIDLWLDHELITEDGHYHYHSRCANFWLNCVDSDGLPFKKARSSDILSPSF